MSLILSDLSLALKMWEQPVTPQPNWEPKTRSIVVCSFSTVWHKLAGMSPSEPRIVHSFFVLRLASRERSLQISLGTRRFDEGMKIISIHIAIPEPDGEDDFVWREIQSREFASVDEAIAWLGATERYERRLEERAKSLLNDDE